tara:strand:+ start:1856 stop:2476 length:621 start_codon:yes stop_codon:yes gene_type:complete
MVNLRIQGQNLYMRPILLTDMATLRTAMTGVWPGDIVPTENEGKAWWYACNKQNETLFGKRNLTSTDKGWLNLTVCKNDDTIIGFQTLKYRGTKVISFMTSIIPTQRGNSYYKEIHTLRHKFIFDSTGLNAALSRVTLPTVSSTINDPVIHTNSTLYTSTHHTIEFPNKGVYAVKEITKAQWTAWIDNSAQSTLKGHTYTLTWASS